MTFLSTHLMRRAVQQHGIVSAQQLHDDGLDHHAVMQLLQRDALVRAQRGVFRICSIPDTFESRCAAACTADPLAVVTGVSAARLWGFRHAFRPHTPELMSPTRSSPLTRVTLRNTNMIVNEDVIMRPDAIRLASPARAWFDCAPHFDDDRFELVTEAVIDEHCDVATLWRTLRRLDARGRLGLGRIRRVLSRRMAWQRPSTQLEGRLVSALAQAGVRSMVLDHSIRLPSNVDQHLTACDPTTQWGVEIDHVSWHGGRSSTARQLSTSRACVALGWSIDVVTDLEIRDDVRRVARRLADSYRAHATRAA